MIPSKTSRRNFISLLWHGAFLALAQNLMDVDTIIPAMLVEMGGSAFHIGLMTAILVGGANITQLFFAPFISNQPFKKRWLLMGINMRVISLLVLGFVVLFSLKMPSTISIVLIYMVLAIFSIGGSFANISYMDLAGKSMEPSMRKKFFSVRQIVTNLMLLFSAFFIRKLFKDLGFPENYSWMFFSGGALLLVASLGFWNLKETISSKFQIKSLKEYFGFIKMELKTNHRLMPYLGLVNTLGLSSTLLPFVLYYAKLNHGLQSEGVTNLLIFKVLGGVFIAIIMVVAVKWFSYKLMLLSTLVLSLMVPAGIYLFANPPFYILFMVGGIGYAIFKIVSSGILLEISGNENRAIYTGISGAGNILPALIPLFGGIVIEKMGFNWFFGFYSLVLLCSLYFVFKIKCKS